MAKALIIIFIGAIFQLSAVWFLGSNRDAGMFFCCRGVPDDIYHLALTNQLVTNFPPQEPGMSGVIVQNYHYLSGLVMADFVRVFNLPLIPTVYQYFAAFISILLGLTVLAVAQLLKLDKKLTYWWLFFLYFHGDILYLLMLLRGKGLDFSVTIFDDASKFLAGPPRSFSITLLFCGLAFFIIWTKSKKLLPGILTAVTLGSLIGFKAYTGIFALLGLAFVAIYYFFKRDFKMLIPPTITLIISLAIHLPVNGLRGALSWNGFYRFGDFFSQPGFGLQNLELMRLSGAVYLLPVFIVAYFIFLFGPTILALFQTKKSLATLPIELNIFLIPATVITAIIGTFFVQSLGGLNTVQFLIALYFILAVYLAIAVSRLPLALGIIIGLFAFLRPAYEVTGNFKMAFDRQGIFVSSQELEGLNFLKNNTDKNAVVALPPDFARQEVSLYVSFLANHPLYIAGYTGVLEDHQVTGAKNRLDHPDFSKVDYLYLPKKYNFNFPTQPIFENQEIKIIKVPKL